MSKKSQKTETDDGIRRLLRYTPGTVGGAAGSAMGLGLGAIAIPGGEAIGAWLLIAQPNLHQRCYFRQGIFCLAV